MSNRRKLATSLDRPRLCMHADDDGTGAHWLEPGEFCLPLGPVMPVPQVVEVHTDECEHTCACCGVAFDAGDVSTEVPHALN